jgi:hypothetical protein
MLYPLFPVFSDQTILVRIQLIVVPGEGKSKWAGFACRMARCRGSLACGRRVPTGPRGSGPMAGAYGRGSDTNPNTLISPPTHHICVGSKGCRWARVEASK